MTKTGLRVVQEECEHSIDRLVRALNKHGFAATSADTEFQDEEQEFGIEIVQFGTGARDREAEARRFGALLTEFYSSAHLVSEDNDADTRLAIDKFDAEIEDEVEFELTFRGLENLILMPKELFGPGDRARIILRYRAKMDRFAAFLEHRRPD